MLTWTSTAVVWAQLNLAGTVTDERDQPLAGVTVNIGETTVETKTKANGQFTFRTYMALPLTLTVTCTGYRRQQVAVRGSNFRQITVRLLQETKLNEETVTAVSRVPEPSQQTALTVEKRTAKQLQNAPVSDPFDVLQQLKGVDLLTQSFLFKSVAVRGFGSTTNYRLVQLNDGMDNRSPGLGFGFGNVAGLPDLDVEHIELVPGASSALYGPDAEQGILLTTSKNPFTHQGLGAQLKLGINNVGKSGFGPKPFGDLAIRYARQLGKRLAIKVNVQRLSGTDFIADDYSDRSTRSRTNFFATDPGRGSLATGIGYVPNNDPTTNFQYDGVNVYGDDITNGGTFRFPVDYANASLQNRLVTRTGYTELDMLGNSGNVMNTRANASLHYKLPGNLEASLGWYYGNGNFVRTADFREYVPVYQRHQLKAELRGDDFFLRAYTTRQRTEAWNLGQTATAITNTWKSTPQWASEFGQAYVENKVTVGLARVTADRGRYLPGSTAFDNLRDAYANTFTTDFIPGSTTVRGTRYRDNSALWHYEGMYDFTRLLNFAEVLVGGSIRRYDLNTGGTSLARKADGSEYTINEYGAYIQAARELDIGDELTVKPTLALRYDKNQYLSGGFTPRVSVAATIGNHNFRASWQTAFRNPSPGELFGVPASGDVGGLPSAFAAAGLLTNPIFAANDVLDFTAGRLTAAQLQSRVYKPTALTTEKLETWEIGYKTLIHKKLSLDAFYFHSQYTNFLTTQPFGQPADGQPTNFATNAYRTLYLAVNSTNDLFVNGGGFGAEYSLWRSFTLSGNFTHQVGTVTLRDAAGNLISDNDGVPIVNRRMSNPAVVQKGRNYFNSPENRYNLSVANPHLTSRLGATLTYRWTDRMWYEQGNTAGDVWLPSWSSLDAQVSYKLSSLKSVLKLGGTNLLNQYYSQGYGLARIGGLYYISLTFDELMR